jgi:hypothetical protein
MLDNGQLLVIWVGKYVSLEFLVHVFGVDRIEAVVDMRKVIFFSHEKNILIKNH